jgi:D-glycero-D-manno-heptose 1,7-bisphosphate phosphatase
MLFIDLALPVHWLKYHGAAKQRAVFLDRDGVINSVIFRNGRITSPRSLREFSPEPNIAGPLQSLKHDGFKLFVVTNQPDIARGLLNPKILERINRELIAWLPIESIEICPHDDNQACKCRKPKPGMLFALAERSRIELRDSFMIGDSWRDMEAARAALCTAIILDRFYNRNDDADYRVATLGDAVNLISRHLRHERSTD